MLEVGCDHEEAVMRAVVSDDWSELLQAHVAICAYCSDVVGFSRLLREPVASPEPELPPACYVWWRSRLRQRNAAQERLSRLFAFTETVTVLVSMIGLAGWISWQWSDVSAGIKTIFRSTAHWPSLGLAPGSAVFVVLGCGLLCLNILLTIRAVITSIKK